MGGAKGVVNAFFSAWEATQTTLLPERLHLIQATCQHLVWIGLMANIPNEPVFRGVVNIMKSHCELYCSQIRTKVSARLRNCLHQTFP